MNVSMLYILVKGGAMITYVNRFVATYKAFPANYPHTLFVICNDCEPDQEVQNIFAGIPCIFIQGNNEGWDIGAYQEFSEVSDFDVIFCCGVSVNFRRSGWLARLMQAWSIHGEGMYGIWTSRQIRSHIRTTAFMTSPGLLRTYPWKVKSHAQRYEFEHGDWNFMEMVQSGGFPTLLVTWDGIYQETHWRVPRNIFRRGDQSNCLAFDNHCDGYQAASPQMKRQLERLADFGQ